ncbi:hypothetical protein H696_06056 [Fonticula alba]|uniref:DASH complex subunit DAD2 n=1 Tax=Fonticula alba TaxID=691883 RepID=A0A058Z0V5_FONAL|nr:hypothetical protein H696_06056 [Fonticula alba]KCV67538.1 hypothetical protein H696_06056 [Fonticula alba]|eukprot:XP_009498099.1 hypothetical protein H696_06056 [Fonticula alba]
MDHREDANLEEQLQDIRAVRLAAQSLVSLTDQLIQEVPVVAQNFEVLGSHCTQWEAVMDGSLAARTPARGPGAPSV